MRFCGVHLIHFRNNPRHSDRENITLGDIPFVQEWWKDQ